MSTLSELAARYGILESFQDARGETRKTTAETRQALLAAMGVEANDEISAQAALDELRRQEWLSSLQPVYVIYRDAGVEVSINCPASAKALSWELELEDGKKRRGTAEFASLALIEKRKVDGVFIEKRTLTLEGLPLGYHRLSITPGDGATILIVTPGQCYLPPSIEQGRRLWGVAAQLYLLKSENNWGIGDFTDLAELVQLFVENGADAVGLNPLHAMFIDAPEQASPYSPASRLLLNVLNIDVARAEQAFPCSAAKEYMASDKFQSELQACRDSALVDYSRATGLKIAVLRIMFAEYRERQDAEMWPAFEVFRKGMSPMENRSCLFLALREHFSAQTPARADWSKWPQEFQAPDSPAVQSFAREHEEQVSFQVWMQFIADGQLAKAATLAEGMEIGLYRDLAVGADAAGAETWTNAKAVITKARVGAPPDIYNPPGQNWGLPPFSPIALKKEAYQSFVELLRANMRHAGGLRIDHVMALQQLYWIPEGASAATGAYVRYPREDLIGILALESHRHRCLVVGEDLGTVPEGFRERMAEARVLSYRVLFFEKTESGFIGPENYPSLSLAVAGSHDLPTLRAWLGGDDLVLKETLDLYPTAKLKKDAEHERAHDTGELLKAFTEQGLAPSPALARNQFADNAHAFLASTASAITMLQIDDITRESVPVNVPTTSDQNPNWRRRLSMTLEQIAGDPHFHTLAQQVSARRCTPLVPPQTSAPKSS